jgi:hypothetical protein
MRRTTSPEGCGQWNNEASHHPNHNPETPTSVAPCHHGLKALDQQQQTIRDQSVTIQVTVYKKETNPLHIPVLLSTAAHHHPQRCCAAPRL